MLHLFVLSEINRVNQFFKLTRKTMTQHWTIVINLKLKFCRGASHRTLHYVLEWIYIISEDSFWNCSCSFYVRIMFAHSQIVIGILTFSKQCQIQNNIYSKTSNHKTRDKGIPWWGKSWHWSTDHYNFWKHTCTF